VEIFSLSQVINQLLRDGKIILDPLVGELVAAFIFFGVAVIIGFVVYHFIERYLTKLAQKTATTLDDEIIKNVKRPIYYLVMLVGFYYGVYQITALNTYQRQIEFVFLALEVFLVAFIITRVINVFVAWYAERKEKQEGQPLSKSILVVFRKLLHAVVYIFAFIALLFLGHVDLSGALVGLGVGGIAIAFALQNVLGDAFSAFSIYFDRPFEIGDYIVIGEFGGVVTHVSMKSTRLKLVTGEELVISNRTILDKNIQNFKKLQQRTFIFKVGVRYDTPVEKLRKIHGLLSDIIASCPKATVNRIHFKTLANSSLDFEVMYTLDSPDYLLFLDTQEKINFGILEAFQKEGIELAYPTQTILLAKHNA